MTKLGLCDVKFKQTKNLNFNLKEDRLLILLKQYFQKTSVHPYSQFQNVLTFLILRTWQDLLQIHILKVGLIHALKLT